MKLRHLKWIFFLVLVLFFLFVEFASYNLAPFLGTRAGRLAMDVVILVGCLFLLGLAFDVVSRMNARLERQNRELLTLHRSGLDIYRDLSLDTLLAKVVEQAAQLLEARYGAVAVYDEDREIIQFVTSGLSREEERSIGEPPSGRGLLGVPLESGQRLRLADIASDPRSVGLPPRHPSMRSLLAVPIVCKGPFRGNLYLSEKESAPEFSEEDEETLVRFATAAAIAIDNAYLHERLRALTVAEERVRIAREMHDGTAQVLAYVNTKAQAVKEFLRRGHNEEAGRQLEQLAEAAREVHGDVREQIVGLRTELAGNRSLGEALREFLERWEVQSGIHATLSFDDEVELSALAELQILRIVQEALSNVRKHSGARRVDVVAQRLDGKLVTTVHDNGGGFDPGAKHRGELPRFGLAIMRERAESIGGTLQLESLPGAGTRVRVEVPLADSRLRAGAPLE